MDQRKVHRRGGERRRRKITNELEVCVCVLLPCCSPPLSLLPLQTTVFLLASSSPFSLSPVLFLSTPASLSFSHDHCPIHHYVHSYTYHASLYCESSHFCSTFGGHSSSTTHQCVIFRNYNYMLVSSPFTTCTSLFNTFSRSPIHPSSQSQISYPIFFMP